MAVQRGVDKWKLKKWFSVYAPKMFNSELIGEIPASSEKAVAGRNLTVGLDQLTHNPSNAFTNMVFKITEVNGESASTKLVRMELMFSYIRSLVRRYRSVAYSVVTLNSKDGKSVTVKPLIVTSIRTTRSKIVGIRKEAEQIIKEFISSNDSDAIVSAVIEGKVQADLSARLKHITQINKVEIRKLELG